MGAALGGFVSIGLVNVLFTLIALWLMDSARPPPTPVHWHRRGILGARDDWHTFSNRPPRACFWSE